MVRDSEAADLWRAMYSGLSEGVDGLVGKILARAEAQVLRLSVAYAVLDSDTAVRPSHLRAALAVWDYCHASAQRIFQCRQVPLWEQIFIALGERDRSRTDIHGIFGRNRRVEEIAHPQMKADRVV